MKINSSSLALIGTSALGAVAAFTSPRLFTHSSHHHGRPGSAFGLADSVTETAEATLLQTDSKSEHLNVDAVSANTDHTLPQQAHVSSIKPVRWTPAFPEIQSYQTRVVSDVVFCPPQADKIISFGGSATPQDEPDKSIVGGKGVGLQEMSRIGIAVPPGFTLSTPLCQVFQKEGDLPADVWEAIEQAVARVEIDMGKKYGDKENPLLFSCRSGAAVSMPGMMDTVSFLENMCPINDCHWANMHMLIVVNLRF